MCKIPVDAALKDRSAASEARLRGLNPDVDEKGEHTCGIFVHTLKHFDNAVGIGVWERMTNPAVYLLEYAPDDPRVTRLWSV